MAKFDVDFKLRLVQEYLTGNGGQASLASRYGVGRSTLRLWVALYRAHGRDGLKRKHTTYSAEFKRQVLEHMQREGLSLKEVGALYNIRNPPGIRLWQTLYAAGGLEALAPRPKGRSPAMRKFSQPDDRAVTEKTVEELQRENEYLRTEVAYLKKLQEIVQAKQQAAQAKPKRSTP